MISVAPKNLGETLVERGLITEKQLENALELQRKDGKGIRDILVEQGLVTADDLAMATSICLGIPLIDLKQQKPQPEALALIPEKLARKYNVLPLDVVDSCLVLVMANPEDSLAYQDAESWSGKRIEPLMAPPDDIRQAINQNYVGSGEITADIQQAAEVETEQVIESLLEKAADSPLSRVINLIVLDAVKNRASDIHIEPQRNRVRIRFRIDGVLHEVRSLPFSIHPIMISRLKILAKMNIAEQRLPQDGRFTVKVGGDNIDIRMATFRTLYGEMAVLRLLSRRFTFINLDELGFNPWSIGRYQHLLGAPFGMILTSGPTGSGKTTTLYASINRLKQDERNILTIEDPMEYEIEGVNQGQVNPKAGITFASGLRAMLRLDPDVIVVGEIRDKETAQMAVQAALTGRLVLSSVHANNAARTFFRLVDLGVEPSLISASVMGVVAQRIVRRVCPHCCASLELAPDEQAAYQEEMNEELDHYQHGEGCNFCANTGYLGRIGLFEVMLVSDAIQRMVVEGASPQQIETQAIKEGMIPMRRDGMMKVKEGMTTPSEVLKNVFSIDPGVRDPLSALVE